MSLKNSGRESPKTQTTFKLIFHFKLKSTFLKQMQIIHGAGFNTEEILKYRTQIYENVLKGIAGLLNGKRELKLPWRGSLPHEETTNAAEISQRMINILKNFLTIYKQLMDDRELQSIRISNKQVHIKPEQFKQCIYLVIEIWNDDSIRETYERRREFPKYFVENVPYFIENLERISHPVSFIKDKYKNNYVYKLNKKRIICPIQVIY